MKFLVLPILICAMQLYSQNKNDDFLKEGDSFYVGTYTGGDSEGIYKYRLKADGTIHKIGLAAKSENPSFLTLSHDKRFLLAANEINSENGMGTVESFLIKGDSLSLINKKTSGGAHPCYISTNASNYVLTANYSSGNIGLLKLNDQGVLSKLLDVQQHFGKGTTERQTEPHAHFSKFDFDNKAVISVDLGTNQLWFSILDTLQQKLLPATPNKLSMANGAGPRHLAFHPNKKWIYVINELDCTVTLIKKNNESIYEKGGAVSTLPKNYTAPNTSADIHISSDGKFLYTSNRGHNSIAIFKVNMKNGDLKLIGHASTKGDGPRNFSLSPDGGYLLVANQNSNNIVSFKRNKDTGELQYVDQIDVPMPVCILFN